MQIKSFIALVAVLGLPAGQAMAQTSANDSVVVTGTVQEVISVSIAGGSPSFDITPEVAVTDQDLGTVTINSNDPDGYDVELTASRDGSILQNSAADESIAYTVKYSGGTAQSLSKRSTGVVESSVGTPGWPPMFPNRSGRSSPPPATSIR